MAETDSTVVTFQPLNAVDRIRKLCGDEGVHKRQIAPGIKGDSYWCAWAVEGRRSALLACGLAQEEWFSDGSEKTKRGFTVRARKFVIDGRPIATLTKKKSDYVRVSVRRSDGEIQAFRERNAEREEAEAEQRKAAVHQRQREDYRRESGEKEAAMSVEEWREACLLQADVARILIVSAIDGHGHKRIGAEQRGEVDRLLQQICAVISTCQVMDAGRPQLRLVE